MDLSGVFFKKEMETGMNEKMVTAYLERIHETLHDRREPEELNDFIRSHIRTVPFENVDVADLGMIPDLDEAKIYEKVIEKCRGGYCFELNKLFGSLISALGYDVYPVAVRVMWNRDYIPPVSHMGLVAEIKGEKYYCDVGFGGPGPKGLLSLKESQQSIEGEQFRTVCAEDGDFLIERMHHGEWKQVLRFTDRKVRDEDFQLLNFYCARNEKVLFARTRVANICIPGGSKALQDRELTVRVNGEERRMIYETKKELEACLEQEFGIRVTLPEGMEGGDIGYETI